MTELTRGFLEELKNQSANLQIGIPALELLSTTMGRIGKHVDIPVRLYAAATPDEYLYFGSNVVEAGDGAGKTTPPVDDLITTLVADKIGFQTKSAPASVKIDGSAFSFPATTIGQYRRLALSLLGDGTLSARWSSASASVGALDNPGVLFSTLDGLPVGYIDLECTAADGKFKTAGSATSVIENKVSGNIRIFRFGAGGGAGAGGDSSFKVKQISNGSITVKKGKWTTDKGLILISGDVSTDAPVDFNLSLGDIVASPTTTTLYWLCIDLSTLTTFTTLSDTRQKVLKVYQASQFKLIADDLEHIQKDRYIPVASAYTTAASWTGCVVKTTAPRWFSSLSSYFSYPEQKVQNITSATTTNITHGLSGEPQEVFLYFYDNSTGLKSALDLSSHLANKNGTTVSIDTTGLTFDTSDYVQVVCIYQPSMSNGLTMASTKFTSPWYSDTATTTVAHGLSNMDDIASYTVQEWDVTNGKRRNVDNSGLVINFDDTNLYLDWSGITPSSTLKYRVITGGTALPAAIPYARKNSYTFTDAVSLTTTSTAYPLTIINDSVTDIRILQKMATDRWQLVPVVDTVFVEKASGIWYLRGDLTNLVPSGSNPVKIVVSSDSEF